MKRLSLLLLLAIFSCTKEPVMYTLTTNSTEGGAIFPPTGEYEAGTTVVVSATPDSEYLFTGWSGYGNGDLNPLEFVINSDISITANFVKKKYPLTINIEGQGIVSEEIVNSGKSSEYNSGTTVMLTAQASEGWKFDSWSGSINGNENPKNIIIGEPKVVNVKFIRANPIYLDENGVTIKAYEWAEVGEKGIINDIEYTIIDESLLKFLCNNGAFIEHYVTSKVTNMDYLFSHESQFNQDISAWDVSNVNSMYMMFSNATSFNQQIGNWDTSSVTDMSTMFSNAKSFNQPIGNWNISGVKNISNIFNNAISFNQPLGNWDTSSLTIMVAAFKGAISFNQPIGNWNTSQVTNMSFLFQNADEFNQDIGNWDTSKVTEMEHMFDSARSFNKPIGNWNTTSLVKARHLFLRAEMFNQPIENWDTSSVTDMTGMFREALLFNQNLSSWCVSNFISSPLLFDYDTPAWILPKPIWGTCPQ